MILVIVVLFHYTEPDVDFLPSLCDQGVLWFKDLTQSSYTLAMLYGGVNLTLTEVCNDVNKIKV